MIKSLPNHNVLEQYNLWWSLMLVCAVVAVGLIIIFGRYCWFALHVAIGYAVEAVVLMNHCWLPLT